MWLTSSSSSSTPSSSSTSTPRPTTHPSADTRPQQSTPAPPRVAPSLGEIAVGMTKQQVAAAIGKANVESADAWFYADAGWVRFSGEKVSRVEIK